jgi:methyl-accepting chemotaxis protein-1 (serine sensor receptor)
MKISTKLIMFFCGVVTLFVLLAVALLAQTRTVSAGYDALLARQVRQAEEARVIQVGFKKQVQEWKDILLRGHTPDDLARYTKQFHDEEADVRSGAQALAAGMQDAGSRDLLEQFVAAHKAMGEKYQAAYDAFVASGFDFKVADKMVRGQDRAPTNLFDQVVKRLNDDVVASVAAQERAVERARDLALALSGGLLAGLGLVGFVTVRTILQRLGRLKAVSDRLANADIEGLSVDISGPDEIGQFGDSMKGVHAAIEELTKLASAGGQA